MNRPININSKGEQVNLKEGKYRIYVLGGWGVNLGSFTVSFKDKKTNELITSKKAIYSVQTFAFKKRAKRIFVVDIPKPSNYEVIFENSKSLKVKKSNLLISSIFREPILEKRIEILITEKFGILPLIG